MVIDAGAKGNALPAAEIATLIGEHGLGGDDVDLRERLNTLRRDRSSRARDARAMAQRWAEIASAPSPLGEGRGGGREECNRVDGCTDSFDARASPPDPHPNPSPQGEGN